MLSETVDGYVGSYQFELTSSNTQTYFSDAINTLLNIASETPSQLSSTDLTNYNNALNSLKDLALGNIPGTTQPLDVAITAEMATSINSLLSLTQSVNNSYGDAQIASINNSVGLNSLQELTSWQDVYNSGASSIVTNAATHADSTAITTLQSYLQADYIDTGNQILSNQLTSLQQAISATQQAMILLGDVQNLKNDASVTAPTYTVASEWSAGVLPTKKIVTKSGKQVLTQIGVGSIASYYESSTSSTIGSRLLINVSPSFAANIQSQGMQLVSQLNACIASINAADPSEASDQNGLAMQLQTVVNDMTAGPPTANGSTQTASAAQSDLATQLQTIYGVLQTINTILTNSHGAITGTLGISGQVTTLMTEINDALNNPSATGSSAVDVSAILSQCSTLTSSVALLSPSQLGSYSEAIANADQDMTTLTNKANSISWWVLDNYNSAATNTGQTTFASSDFNTANAGNYQRDLTNAITSAENLNDSQKSSLQTALFNFQEFYQSAAAVLTMIQQFMQQIESNINH